MACRVRVAEEVGQGRGGHPAAERRPTVGGEVDGSGPFRAGHAELRHHGVGAHREQEIHGAPYGPTMTP